MRLNMLKITLELKLFDLIILDVKIMLSIN